MHDIYFDNSATTRVCEQALNAAVAAMREDYGNPSSAHNRGATAFHALNEARRLFAAGMQVAAEEIYFTSGGTEANNTAIFGAMARGPKQGKRLLISAGEHPSVSEPAKQLAARGYDLRLIPVREDGQVDLEALESLLSRETALVSVMHVNNETGAVQPLCEVGALVRRLAPQALFHIDGVQSFARLPLDLHSWQADSFSASGHKIHAPKGIGLLWLNRGRRLPPLLYGGGQEKNFRSGTENMPGILAFAAAYSVASGDRERYAAAMRAVKKRLAEGLLSALPQVAVNGPPPGEGAPHILNLSFIGVRSEVLLHHLAEQGVYVSAGSACNSRNSKGSTVLLEMGLNPERVDSALRFSFSRMNSLAEAETALPLIIAAVEELRLLVGRWNKRR